MNGKLVATEPLQPGYHTIIIPPEEIPITESEQYIVELVCPYYVNRAKELGERTREMFRCVCLILAKTETNCH